MCACIVQKSWPSEGLMCHVSISITISDAIAYYLRKYMALWPAVLQRWRWWRRLHCRLRQLELYSFYCCVEILQLPLQISISIIQYYCSLFGCYCPIQFHRRRLWLSLSHSLMCECVNVWVCVNGWWHSDSHKCVCCGSACALVSRLRTALKSAVNRQMRIYSSYSYCWLYEFWRI